MEQDSLSKRRTSTTQTLRAPAKAQYEQDLVGGSDRPQLAIILRSTEQKRPLMTSPIQLLRANFNSTSVSEEVLITEVPRYYTYKVWPIEYNSAALEPPKSLSAVKGIHQGRINMAPDAFCAPGSDFEGVGLPEGLVCEYRYGDKYSLSPILLTRPADIQFQLPGVKMDDTWKSHMKQRFQLDPMNIPGPVVPVKDTIDFFNKMKGSGKFPGFCDAMIAGMVANAKSESNFRNNAVGDKVSDLGANARRTERAIFTTPRQKTKWTGTGGEDYYCSFGYWQLNVCGGGGVRFAKKFGFWPTHAGNKQALLTAIHDPDKQFDFMFEEMKRIFGSKVSDCSLDGTYWGQQIAIKFEKCVGCFEPGYRKVTESGRVLDDRGTLKRGAVAQGLLEVVNKGGIPGRPIPPID